MKLRPATLEDSAFLFILRNEPEVRNNSFSSDELQPGEHELWLINTIHNPDVDLYIAESEFEGQAIGYGRIEYIGSSGHISIAILPEIRLAGLGQELIKLLTDIIHAKNKVAVAWIKTENIPSLVAFMRSGFKLKDEYVCMSNRAE